MSSYQRKRCYFRAKEVAGSLPDYTPVLVLKFTYGDHLHPGCEYRLPSMNHK
jgi:hypothetical protein